METSGGQQQSYQQTGALTPGSGAQRPPCGSCCLLGDLRRNPTGRLARAKAIRFARELTVKAAMRRAQPLDSIELDRAYACLLLSRVYVGGLQPEVTEAELAQLLSTCGPVYRICMPRNHMHMPEFRNKTYAFANFLLPEAALLAIQTMNSVLLRGSPLRVGRPANMANCGALLEALASEYPDRSHRVYVANVPLRVTESQVKAALEVYGRLTDVQLVPDPAQPGHHRGYGFARFYSATAASAALDQLGGGGKRAGATASGPQLRLGRLVAPPDAVTGCLFLGAAPPPSALAPASAALLLTAQTDGFEGDEDEGRRSTSGSAVAEAAGSPGLVDSDGSWTDWDADLSNAL